MDKLVFFVDDDRMIINLLEYILKNRSGYSIKTFTSGEDCLSNLSLNPDIIVLDHIFEGQDLSGIDILKEIRKRDIKIPVIILTSHDDKETREQFRINGANYFIPKNDYFIDDLMEKIDSEL